ncbi:MAG: asparagine synthetase B, partial [Alphaproteobacteria bacterium]|nr:asparagine synthetase B [Alphaproteobacteria bacterium]
YSLEVRCPLLDYRLVEFAWSLPDWASFGADGTKRALRHVLARRVPRALFERPKSGFEPPVGDWLRGPLRDWAEDLLAPAALEAAGLNPAPVRARWARHLGGRNATYPLWTILMFQAWRRAR